MDRKTLIVLLRTIYDTNDLEALPTLIESLEREGLTHDRARGVYIVNHDDAMLDITLAQIMQHDLSAVALHDTFETPKLDGCRHDHFDQMEKLLASVIEQSRDFTKALQEHPEKQKRGFDYREANKAPRSAKRKR
jgi:hypothetical protein